MRSDRRWPVAIVGAGFSGTMVAAQLAQRGMASVVIEAAGRPGRGVAYSTHEPAHLLNVRAEAMSAWPDRPADFAEFFEGEGGVRRGFAPRLLYGHYVRGILDRGVADGLVQQLGEAAVRAERVAGEWRLNLANSEEVRASALVLANGNQPPEPLKVMADAGDRFINDPWSEGAQAAVREAASSGGDVLLIGTGLTMIDLVLSLDAAGHRGRVVAVSRRGLLPRAHAEFTPAPVAQEAVPHGKVLPLWRWLRRRAGEVGWRAAVDSLRPHSQAIWQALSSAEQRRFLRHARPWWDVHRHRIAPEIAARLRDMIAAGQLEVVAGRIHAVESLSDSLAVHIIRRGTALPLPPLRGSLPFPRAGEGQRFAYAFNCTGPLGAIQRTHDDLLRGLMASGTVRPDSLGMGLEVDERSRAGERLWALGPLTKGRYWEIVAVPDIRVQAAAVAADIAEELEA